MEQLITLAPGEGLPGFPSGHGPGDYLVDFKARTIRPVIVAAVSGTAPIAEPPPEPTTDAQPVEEPQIEQGG